MTKPRPPSTAVIEAAATWLLQRQNGGDLDDDPAFLDWLNSAPEHRREYQRLERLWSALDCCTPPRRSQRPRAHRVLLTLAGLLLAAHFYWAEQEEWTTLPGQMQVVQLPDGSTLHIDANTVLRRRDRLWQRQLELERGQILVEVAPSLRPLRVLAGQGEIRDIGTRFSVRQENERTQVAVSNGEVAIRLAAASSELHLQAGQRVSYQGQNFSAVDRLAPAQGEAWLSNHWEFAATPLTEVIAEINFHHARTVQLADPALGGQKISGIFRRDQRDELVTALCQLLTLRASETASGTMLQRR